MAAGKQGNIDEIEHYMCVECGARAEETYKQYSRDIIKLTQCVRQCLICLISLLTVSAYD